MSNQQYKTPPKQIPESAACGNCRHWEACGKVKGYLKINLIPQCWEPKKGFKRSRQYNTANRLKEQGRAKLGFVCYKSSGIMRKGAD